MIGAGRKELANKTLLLKLQILAAPWDPNLSHAKMCRSQQADHHPCNL